MINKRESPRGHQELIGKEAEVTDCILLKAKPIAQANSELDLLVSDVGSLSLAKRGSPGVTFSVMIVI